MQTSNCDQKTIHAQVAAVIWILTPVSVFCSGIRKQESLDAGHPVFDELWFRLNERIFLLDLGQK